MSKLVIDLSDPTSIRIGENILKAICEPVKASDIPNIKDESLNVPKTAPVPPKAEAPAPTPPPVEQVVPTTPETVTTIEELNAGMVEVFGRLGSRTAIDAVLTTYNGATSISTIDPALYSEVLAKVKAL